MIHTLTRRDNIPIGMIIPNAISNGHPKERLLFMPPSKMGVLFSLWLPLPQPGSLGVLPS